MSQRTFARFRLKTKRRFGDHRRANIPTRFASLFNRCIRRIPFGLDGFCSDDLACTGGAGWIYFAELIDLFLVTNGGLNLDQLEA